MTPWHLPRCAGMAQRSCSTKLVEPLVALELARWTARLSLAAFLAAFAGEAGALSAPTKRRLYLLFVGCHVVHLSAVAAYLITLGEPPESLGKLSFLVLGVLVMLFCLQQVLRKREQPEGRVVSAWAVWYLWLLFGVTHLTRLFDPTRPRLLHGLLLMAVIGAALLRVRVGRERKEP